MRPSAKYYHEQQQAMLANLDDAVLEWARGHALDVKLGDIVGLATQVKSIAQRHARDIFEHDINAQQIDEAAVKAA